jgi:putative phosphoserine phosphatase / 1-acylglycerol-3-phosphate O-acyltransferase
MATLDELLDAIAAAPPGPQIAAFFDYDGTVIDNFSASAFYRHRIRHFEIGPVELVRTLLGAARGIDSGEDFEEFLKMALGAWRGRDEEEMRAIGDRLFKHEIAGRMHAEAWRLVQAHHAMGHRVVLASSATRFQVEPMARELEADHVLCTPVEVVDGIVTGRTAGPVLWGEGKARAARALAAEHDLDLDECFAYSNGAEDVPFLESAGHPVCVDPESALVRVAHERGWPILRCAPRPGTPPPLDVARTVGFYGAMAAAGYAGAAIGLLRRSRKAMVDVTGAVGSDLGLAVAGIDVDIVSGAEHLWSARPCVFVFNHQSKLDTIVVAKLLRSEFTGVAKKEAANVPGFGQFFRLAGVAFIDRSDPARAREALTPAVEKIRDEGLSLVMAPEGTRSATPRLGPFKKGAFHIAMQAGVPMVPIVLRNVGELMWRGAQTLRPGTIEVCVLAPVDTSDWRRESVADHVAEVRGMFLETLEHWPTEPDRRAQQVTR